ncbi:MAG: MerR family transcriptional regulator [Acidimicrobiales bacterium]
MLPATEAATTEAVTIEAVTTEAVTTEAVTTEAVTTEAVTTEAVTTEAAAALWGIGEAAARAGVSERALRYYQQIGLLVPSGRTPGGMRRYSVEDVARVVRIRELQGLLGFNLDEVAAVLGNEDRLGELRRAYHAEESDGASRARLVGEGIALHEQLRATIDAKVARLGCFRAEVEGTIQRCRALLAAQGGGGGSARGGAGPRRHPGDDGDQGG